MKPYLVVKIGGRPAAEQKLVAELFAELAGLRSDWSPLLIHGGGAEVSDLSRKLGIEPQIVNGVRNTRTEEMEIVDMVLAGLVNTRLLRWARAAGLNPVGLSCVDGGLLTAESVGPDSSVNRTGRAVASNPAVVEHLCGGGFFPVISSVADDTAGGGLNLNADDAALAIASAVRAGSLVYISDISGVLADGSVIPHLDPVGCEREIAAGVITGGMIPKVRSACSGLEAGIGCVVIGGYAAKGDLSRLVAGAAGTTISGGAT